MPQEMIGVIVTPIKLWTIYPRDAVKILGFIQELTDSNQNIGDVTAPASAILPAPLDLPKVRTFGP